MQQGLQQSALLVRHESLGSLVEAGLHLVRSHVAVLLPASIVYDGIGPLLVEWALPTQEVGIASFTLATNLFVSGVLSFLGSYAIAAGLWRICRGESLRPTEVLAAPWREAEHAMPLAFLFAAILVAGFQLGMVPAVLAEIFLIVLAPVAAVEHRGGTAALRRAFELGRGWRWRAVGILALLTLLLLAVSLPAMASGSSHGALMTVTALLAAGVDCVGDTLAFVLYGDLRQRESHVDPSQLAPVP